MYLEKRKVKLLK